MQCAVGLQDNQRVQDWAAPYSRPVIVVQLTGLESLSDSLRCKIGLGHILALRSLQCCRNCSLCRQSEVQDWAGSYSRSWILAVLPEL
ncbi:hypothetical protein PoB_005638400 [Plakobranchus ocellatus]|uniref:Uncharacterized protein n=1 Tax=Plakobranchus ocellatus TaxID=259542 RepID=A0AAV4CGE9_9GAST|nr:hypothetical protein PoB_005638400 [Plakobranchus ocellatus]